MSCHCRKTEHVTNRKLIRDFSDHVRWISQEGVSCCIHDLTDEHLQNIIAKIEREQWRLHYLPILREEVEIRRARSKEDEELKRKHDWIVRRALEHQEEIDQYQPREI